ncbi:hypothetical protein [Actinotignum urinale]|uniref:hypothetical protein n=1 Tax=Actinotignum urinale TaxID=190146 RepID=UPI0003B49321|nr:hypothetical protein [Actinotignum urinale]MDY5159557.1 hypothetical protein [Actinotignum urinale]
MKKAPVSLGAFRKVAPRRGSKNIIACLPGPDMDKAPGCLCLGLVFGRNSRP